MIPSLYLEDTFDGALKQRKTTLSGGNASVGSGFVNGQLDFDASQDDATYAYNKLQVASLQALACIKL